MLDVYVNQHQRDGYSAFCPVQLASLDLMGNKLSGPLPASWGYMPQVSQTDRLAAYKSA